MSTLTSRIEFVVLGNSFRFMDLLGKIATGGIGLAACVWTTDTLHIVPGIAIPQGNITSSGPSDWNSQVAALIEQSGMTLKSVKPAAEIFALDFSMVGVVPAMIVAANQESTLLSQYSTVTGSQIYVVEPFQAGLERLTLTRDAIWKFQQANPNAPSLPIGVTSPSPTLTGQSVFGSTL